MFKISNMKRKINKVFITSLIILCTVSSNVFAFENPGSIQYRGGKYFIYLPSGKGDYVFDAVGSTVLSIRNPTLGYVTQFVRGSYSSKLNGSDIKASENAMKGLIKDKALEAFTPKQLEKLSSKLSKVAAVYEVATTYKEIKTNLKNDTTDYPVNIVLSRSANLISKSRLSAIAKYSYARSVITDLRDKGHIKVTMPKWGESTLRAKVTYTSYGRTQLKKMQKDLATIDAQFVKKKIK